MYVLHLYGMVNRIDLGKQAQKVYIPQLMKIIRKFKINIQKGKGLASSKC